MPQLSVGRKLDTPNVIIQAVRDAGWHDLANELRYRQEHPDEQHPYMSRINLQQQEEAQVGKAEYKIVNSVSELNAASYDGWEWLDTVEVRRMGSTGEFHISFLVVREVDSDE